MGTALGQTLIVMPAYNESQSVGRVVSETRATLPGITVLVVDDGSTDGTSDVARAAGALVATLPFNLGVGGAMRVGFRYAAEHGFHAVVQIDADGQHDPATVAALLERLDDYDIVIGARFAGEGAYVMRGPRRWASWVLARVISRTARSKLTDTTSGFRASGPRAIELFSREYPAEYLGDTIESLVLACRAGLTATQVPTAMRHRSEGAPSQSPVRAAIYLARATLALMFAYARPKAKAPSTSEVPA
ncbi:glycosyltransferase family 2 protein [Demequina sp. TTPB684]|uniref:glycosyltransferase family 2 protein n=1 Tax=unclassified Demequina TaxID=2620311 RepID=UPI001CF4768E|nr:MULTISPECIES: glycosyltransferase family 2 protein [unclassified Demequina]MCB2413627.1 glycosyltransferase family 2 protein [Demequina sp. TTPB684]UPU88250.1 glycosyltransferase family 2 protein [Demequina sp. TMPB413]